MLKKALLAFAIAAFASTGVTAAGVNGVSLSKDKKVTSVPHGSAVLRPAHLPPAGLDTIWSNIGVLYPKGLYFCCYGFTISGPDSVIGSTIWLAAQFTPDADHTVKEVDVAVGYVTGTNAIKVALYTDAGGVPGTLLESRHSSGLTTFGDCCGLAVMHINGGIPVTAGTPYWVVVTTTGKGSDLWAAWNFNSTNQIDAVPIAGNDGTGWSSFGGSIPGPSFGVYGD